MNVRSKYIYRNVLTAMQDAEEIGGPEGSEYIVLMNAIADEAKSRARTYAASRDRSRRRVRRRR